jgi:hypothetical protein
LNKNTASLWKVQIDLSQEPETFDRQMFKNYHVFSTPMMGLIDTACF